MVSTKLIRLSKSGIEYLDYSWNFYSGCRHKEQGKCPPVPCWAEEQTKRFKDVYPNGFETTFYPEAFLSPLYLKKPSRIGVAFMGDLFGDWIEPVKTHYPIISTHPDYPQVGTVSLITHIKTVILGCPQHTFVFLTKNPAGMLRWGRFPDNCEVGFSAWSPDSFIDGLREISKVEAKVKWCSLEPLLDSRPPLVDYSFESLDWVAIGALTGPKGKIMELAKDYSDLTPMKLSARGNRWGLLPPLYWLKNIVTACDADGTKVFLKDNLYQVINPTGHWEKPFYMNVEGYGATLRQECGARGKKASV